MALETLPEAEMRQLRVYIAGAYSADNVIDVLDNMRRGIRAATEVLLAGFAPFCPWLDYHFQLSLRPDKGEELTISQYYRYSMSWLEASDALLVLPNSDHSRGTQAEIRRARELQIPIFYHIQDLQGWREQLRARETARVG